MLKEDKGYVNKVGADSPRAQSTRAGALVIRTALPFRLGVGLGGLEGARAPYRGVHPPLVARKGRLQRLCASPVFQVP